MPNKIPEHPPKTAAQTFTAQQQDGRLVFIRLI